MVWDVLGESLVYRIHFTGQDLARTRLVQTPMPLLELAFAARTLQSRDQPARLSAWRQHAYAQLPPHTRMALALWRPGRWSPGFMSPGLAGRPTDLLEQVRATPRKRINAELASMAEDQSMPSWAQQLGDDPALFRQLVDGIAGLHSVLLSPHEAQLNRMFTADRTVRMRQLLAGGVERLFIQANPRWWRWRPPVLEVRMAHKVDYDLHLEGRGVLLVPSIFCADSCVMACSGDCGLCDGCQRQPVVVYPAGHDQPLNGLTTLAPESTLRKFRSGISVLLGDTRAAVLATIAEHPGCSTKELASLANIAPASASEHATVLREAGLIQTARHRNTALHSPTSLGTALLDAPDTR